MTRFKIRTWWLPSITTVTCDCFTLWIRHPSILIQLKFTLRTEKLWFISIWIRYHTVLLILIDILIWYHTLILIHVIIWNCCLNTTHTDIIVTFMTRYYISSWWLWSIAAITSNCITLWLGHPPISIQFELALGTEEFWLVHSVIR